MLTGSALEGADVFVHYHPNEQKDAEDVKAYIGKVAPNSKVELYAKDLRTEEACMEMVDVVKKWSKNELHVLYVFLSRRSHVKAGYRGERRGRCNLGEG